MTTGNTPASFAEHLAAIRRYAVEEERRLPAEFEACLYYNVIVDDDRARGLEDAKRYLDRYYGTAYAPDYVERWVAAGPPAECIARIRSSIDAGATTVTLRIVGDDQERGFRRVTEEVLPALTGPAHG